jgi:hypothetical protein
LISFRNQDDAKEEYRKVIAAVLAASMIGVSNMYGSDTHCDQPGWPSCYKVGYDDGLGGLGPCPSGHSAAFCAGWYVATQNKNNLGFGPPSYQQPQIAKANTDCSQTYPTQNERYNCGYNRGYLDAQRDWNLHRFPPGSGGDNSCPQAKKHTPEYCNGYEIGYTASWNARLNRGNNAIGGENASTAQQSQNQTQQSQNQTQQSLVPNTSTANTPTATTNPPPDWRIGLLVIFLIIIIAVWKLRHRGGKYKERHYFPDSVKERVLDRQHHRYADCNRVLNVVDWHHRNGDRSDNKESDCVALCPNCHAIRTRRH